MTHLQVGVIMMHDLRTPAVLLASMVVCCVVSELLSVLGLELVSTVVQVVAYCILALFVSWLLLRYGSGSDDVISAIDDIANFLFAMVVAPLIYSFTFV